MIREITTLEQLAEVLQRCEGYLYNDFGGRDPKMCPVHHIGCASLSRMLAVKPGRLGVRKLWGNSLPELIAEIQARGKLYVLCRMEPELLRATNKQAAAPTPQPKLTTPASRERTAEAAVAPVGPPQFMVQLAEDSRRVTCWTTRRLQFDSKPETRALKATIGDAAAQLRAGDGEILEAVYTSAGRDFVDAENVLLYNVGTGRFSASARLGLRFERVYAAADPPPAAIAGPEPHRHDYRIVRSDSASSHWPRGATLLSVRDVPVPRLDAFSYPDCVWAALRLRAPHAAAVHTGLYGLELRLRSPAGEHIRPADIVKPLVDGLVAALHEHDGSDLEHLSASVAARVGLPAHEVGRLLCTHEGALLGRRRLLWRRASSHQWNPGDDTCVTCTIRWQAGESAEGWLVDIDLFEVSE